MTDSPASADLQWADYEELDFQAALDSTTKWICAYSIRKALIRKHFLSQTVREYVAKKPSSILTTAVPASWTLEVDYVEFLDDALDEAFELRGELELNEARDETERRWFILKPSMAERGAGLRLFSTIDELTRIFEENEPEEEEDEDLEEENEVSSLKGDAFMPRVGESTIMTSDMRFFVVQDYLQDPLILPSLNNCKFHVRAYVLCIGSLTVYLHRNLLVLSSAEAYEKPTFDAHKLSKHLTNTCYQMSVSAAAEHATVHSFWNLSDSLLRKEDLWRQFSEITGDLFDAACAQRINFQTLPNAFEIFGIDFLVDANHRASLLEVNAYPDFAQTGESLRHLVDEVLNDTVTLVTDNMGLNEQHDSTDNIQARYAGKFEQCFQRKVL